MGYRFTIIMKDDFMALFKNKVTTIGKSGLIHSRESEKQYSHHSSSIISKSKANAQQIVNKAHGTSGSSSQHKSTYSDVITAKKGNNWDLDLHRPIKLPPISQTPDPKIKKYAVSDLDRKSDYMKLHQKAESRASRAAVVPRAFMEAADFKKFLNDKLKLAQQNVGEQAQDKPKSLAERKRNKQGNTVDLRKSKQIKDSGQIRSGKELYSEPLGKEKMPELKSSLQKLKLNAGHNRRNQFKAVKHVEKEEGIAGEKQTESAALQRQRQLERTVESNRLRDQYGRYFEGSATQGQDEVYKHLDFLNRVQSLLKK